VVTSTWKRRVACLVLLPAALGVLYLAVRTPGLGDSADIWARYEVEADADERMYLLMALALRGELEGLERAELDACLARLGDKQRRGFLFHFPQFAAAAR
jgi:hypothetical protein